MAALRSFAIAMTALVCGFIPSAHATTDLVLAQTSRTNACERASPADAEAIVAKAASLIVELGLPAALLRLMDPRSEFRKGELYVFVLDRRGILRSTRGPGPGVDLTDTRDGKGRFFVKNMLKVAERRGEGWVAYEWVDPCTGSMSEKQTYVKRAGDYVVAAGIYSVART